MRILFFATYYYPYLSGITTYPRRLLRHLALSHDVSVLTFLHDSTLGLREHDQGVEIQRMPFLMRMSKGFISIRSLWYFWKTLDSAELVFLNIPNFEGWPLALMARIRGIPVVSIFHCSVVLGDGLWARLLSAILELSVRFQLMMSSRIITYTSDYIDHLGWNSELREKSLMILPAVAPLSIDLDKSVLFSEMKQDAIWVGFAGRISREKGLLFLAKALHNIALENVEVVFAGPYGNDVVGEERYYDELKRLLAKYGIPHRFFGKLTEGSLGAFYEAIDVLTLPSINKTEAFGMVQVDAMRKGVPVVVSDLPGVRVPVQLTGMGVVVPPGNVRALRSALENVLSDREKYAHKKLQKSAQKVFDEDQTFSFYESLLRDYAK